MKKEKGKRKRVGKKELDVEIKNNKDAGREVEKGTEKLYSG